MAQEHRDSLLREDIVENFLDDDTSSDDNIEDGHIFDDGIFLVFFKCVLSRHVNEYSISESEFEIMIFRFKF